MYSGWELQQPGESHVGTGRAALHEAAGAAAQSGGLRAGVALAEPAPRQRHPRSERGRGVLQAGFHHGHDLRTGNGQVNDLMILDSQNYGLVMTQQLSHPCIADS